MKRFYCVLDLRCDNRCINCCHEHEVLENGKRFSVKEFIGLVDKYDVNKYDILEISGGEPTYNKSAFLEILKWLNESKGFSRNRINVLTGAHKFESLSFAKEASKYLGHVTSTFYSPYEEVHDRFTGTPGSYRKKLEGLINLQDCGVKVHVKTILNSQNYTHVSAFVDLCNENFVNSHVVIGWLCLIGQAWRNKDSLAIDFSVVEPHLNKAIERARETGLNLSLTVPLCILDPYYWQGHMPVDLLTDLEKVIFINPEYGMIEKPANEIPILAKPSQICDECIIKQNCVWEWEGYNQLIQLDKILKPVKMYNA